MIDARLAAPSSSGDATGAAAPPRAVDAQLTRSARPIHTSRACAPTLNAQRGPRSRRARGTASLTALAGRRCHHCALHLTQLRSACSSVVHSSSSTRRDGVRRWRCGMCGIEGARRPRALSSARSGAAGGRAAAPERQEAHLKYLSGRCDDADEAIVTARDTACPRRAGAQRRGRDHTGDRASLRVARAARTRAPLAHEQRLGSRERCKT